MHACLNQISKSLRGQERQMTNVVVILKNSWGRSSSSLPFLLLPRHMLLTSSSSIQEGPGCSLGLRWALAGKGVLVKDKAFRNLTVSELQQKGATIVESQSGVLVHVRGDVLGRSLAISKAQYSKLLKQVLAHMSSISDVFVHDGALGLSSKCDVKVRLISDNPSAVLKLSSILWKTHSRAISHDSSPLTVYAATSMSPAVGDAIGIVTKGNHGFIVVDVESFSLILCDKAFSDINGTKEALAALCGPIISARGGLYLSARLLVSSSSSILLFAPEDFIQSCADMLVSADAGVILSSDSVAPLFRTSTAGADTLKMPTVVIFASADSSGIIPSVAKLSPGQAAYHFLAGYQDGKFVPAYSEGPSSISALELARAFLSVLKEHQISAFLINIKKGKTSVTSEDLLALVQLTTSTNIPAFEPKRRDLREKYQKFMSSIFQEIPTEFSF